jgi:hypothetical protein
MSEREGRRVPIWLIPNLLSLDAPLVAVAWLYIFAQTWRVVYHPWPPYVALALVAWGIYATDRLCDSYWRGGGEGLLLRHRVHKRLRRVLMVAVPAAFGVALWIAMTRLPVAIFSYLLPGGVLVAGFFVSAILAGKGDGIPYTKNLLAGLTFSYGTAIGAHVYTSHGMALGGNGYVFTAGVFDLLRSPEMLTFGVLCALNITAVDVWERGRGLADPEAKAADEMMLTVPLALLALAALMLALRAVPTGPIRPFYYAILVAAALLLVVNRIKHRFSTDALRVIADLCLLAPWLYFVLRDK